MALADVSKSIASPPLGREQTTEKVLSNRLRREFLKYIKCQLQELPVDLM